MKRLYGFSFLLMAFVSISHSYIKTEKCADFDNRNIKRIAIYPFGIDNINMGLTASDAMSSLFLSFGFDVVERTQLYKVLEEIKLDTSGTMGIKERHQIGKLLNVDAIVFGDITGYLNGKVYSVNIRMVEVKSGDIVLSVSYLNWIDSVFTSFIVIGDSLEKTLTGMRPKNKKRIFIARNQKSKLKKYNTVAFMPLLGTNYYGEQDALSGAITTQLIGNGISLIERQSLEGILSEQFKNYSGFYVKDVNRPMIAKEGLPISISSEVRSSTYNIGISVEELEIIGKLTGADALIIGSFSPLFDNSELFKINVVNLRIIDIDKGRVDWSISYFNTAENMADTAEYLGIAVAPLIKTDNDDDYKIEFNKAAKRVNKPEGAPANICKFN